MRNLFFVILLFISAPVFAQKDTTGLHIPINDGAVVYEKVFNAPGRSKAELYSNARLWFVEHYKGINSIEIADTVMSRLVGKGKETVNFIGPLNMAMPFDGKLTIQIDCKDGKYRCRIFNITLSSREPDPKDRTTTTPEDMVDVLTGKSSASPLNKNQARRMLESLNTTINNTLTSLYKTMIDNNDF
jgi:hypothetical protein